MDTHIVLFSASINHHHLKQKHPCCNYLLFIWMILDLDSFVCVAGAWRRPGHGLTLVRVQARSCWMLWSAQEMSSSWISVPMAPGSSTTVITWRMLGSPAALIQVHIQYTNTHTLLYTLMLHKAAIFSLWTSINHCCLKQRHPLWQQKQDLWELRGNISTVIKQQLTPIIHVNINN